MTSKLRLEAKIHLLALAAALEDSQDSKDFKISLEVQADVDVRNPLATYLKSSKSSLEAHNKEVEVARDAVSGNNRARISSYSVRSISWTLSMAVKRVFHLAESIFVAHAKVQEQNLEQVRPNAELVAVPVSKQYDRVLL